MKAIDIISGQERGLTATALRAALIAPSIFYGLIIALRNKLYDWRILKSQKLPTPVICVGNITAGGSGKTPATVWLCRYLQNRGVKVALLSRGYKGNGGVNDEMTMLAAKLPQAALVVDGDRLRGGRRAIKQAGAEVIVLDDGFQHRRLSRDLDIVMIDCIEPFGFGYMLPRGLLRESPSQLKRAGAIILSRSDAILNTELESLKQNIRKLSDKPIALSSHKPVGLVSAGGNETSLNELKGKAVIAFCAIGNPRGFILTLEQLGAKVTGRYYYDDHGEYDQERVEILKQTVADAPGCWLLTTEKDWVKLKELSGVKDIEQLYWLKIELDIIEGQEQLIDAIGKRIIFPLEAQTNIEDE